MILKLLFLFLSNDKLSLHVYLSAFVKTYPLGFHLASGAAWLQASVVPKNVWGLPSWLVQMNSPGTQCLNTGWVDQAWGQNKWDREGAILAQPLHCKEQCLLEALTGKYLVLTLPQPGLCCE